MTLNEIRHQLRTEQYEDEKALNVISKEMILDEWYEVWMNEKAIEKKVLTWLFADDDGFVLSCDR